jgi:hypothetical protein
LIYLHKTHNMAFNERGDLYYNYENRNGNITYTKVVRNISKFDYITLVTNSDTNSASTYQCGYAAGSVITSTCDVIQKSNYFDTYPDGYVSSYTPGYIEIPTSGHCTTTDGKTFEIKNTGSINIVPRVPQPVTEIIIPSTKTETNSCSQSSSTLEKNNSNVKRQVLDETYKMLKKNLNDLSIRDDQIKKERDTIGVRIDEIQNTIKKLNTERVELDEKDAKLLDGFGDVVDRQMKLGLAIELLELEMKKFDDRETNSDVINQKIIDGDVKFKNCKCEFKQEIAVDTSNAKCNIKQIAFDGNSSFNGCHISVNQSIGKTSSNFSQKAIGENAQIHPTAKLNIRQGGLGIDGYSNFGNGIHIEQSDH